MANICSVGLHLKFRTKKDMKAFRLAFQHKLDIAESRNEALKIASSKWLFDGCIYDDGVKGLAVHGSTPWCLDQDSMAEFHKYLKRMKVKSYICDYEETGCQVYGEYSYDGNELWDKYLSDSHPVWHESNTGEDSYFDDMDIALEKDGVLELVA